MSKPKPIEIALIIEEKKDKLEREDEAHRLLGIDTGKDQDFLICSFTKDGKVIIPGRDDEGL